MDPVSPFPNRAVDASVVSSVVELLEVLWGGGRETAASPVSVSQLRVLYVLAENDGINLRTLTETLESRPSSVSRLCDRLEAVGLVRRAASPTSRRELELHLTPTGLAFLADLRAAREQALAAVLDDMSPAERGALLTGLSAFRDVAGRRAADGADVGPAVQTA
ncbi:MarR family transcriptional regulator [Streptomyces sp. TLI_171]|uniref:MarR family transcriptional regulator n=1 Tax=Streptomyces sp. TLI_171 TaxID=1938859 RepID=UPI000C17C405|nr:MarR family transcriptional regulator [Streptomyces sp. TLI_171]RKE23511.1 DNA-binding MarR family transcriptional regulator [Streptomyces sp. TLI_171]